MSLQEARQVGAEQAGPGFERIGLGDRRSRRGDQAELEADRTGVDAAKKADELDARERLCDRRHPGRIASLPHSGARRAKAARERQETGRPSLVQGGRRCPVRPTTSNGPARSSTASPAGERPVPAGPAQKKSRPGSLERSRAALGWMIPAMTDFRARGTIMGLAGLTAVFGMGTGVTPPVWSPESRPAGGQAGPGVSFGGSVTREAGHSRHSRTLYRDHCPIARGPALAAADGSGWSSCSAVRTGRLRRSPAVHSRPIDLVVFQEPSQQLLLETSSWRGLRA